MSKVTAGSLRPLSGSRRGNEWRRSSLGGGPLGASPQTRRRRWLVVVGLLLVAAAGAGAWRLHARLVAGLAQLDGEIRVSGLSAPVAIERDDLGVPTIRAENRIDVARALGFVHAQDRFFQMDLLRRQAAGELAELVGAQALPLDRQHRLHRFRSLAQRSLAMTSEADRAILAAYADGVNAGLAALGDKPFEYVLLRTTPAPWHLEDSLLATDAMFFSLNDSTGRVGSALDRLRRRVPPALFAFLAPQGTEWDAPLLGGLLPSPPLPGPEVFDLRKSEPVRTARLAPLPVEEESESSAGSNCWAVSGAHTADGHALLANDMHLGIGVPNTWYRVSLVWSASDGTPRRVTGVTLPGTPAVAVGSNGHVAWGFTNSYGDYSDLVEVEVDPPNGEIYRTPGGPRRFERHVERLQIRGGGEEVLEARWTIWGPIVGTSASGRPLALSWIAHHPEATNLGLLGLESARTVNEAIGVANAAGIPPQNFTVVDADGHIGWTIIGKVPRRIGFDGRLPTSWADGSRRWDGWLSPAEIPKVVDPPDGRIWTANARVVGGAMLERLGDGGYALGARARQIRDRLLALDHAKPGDMLAIQLDDRALFLARWRTFLLRLLTRSTLHGHPRRAELRRLVEVGWNGRAAASSVGYRIVHDYREVLLNQVYSSFAGEPGGSDAAFFSPNRQFEGPLWTLVNERPPHLLDPRFVTWDDALLAPVDVLLARYGKLGRHLNERTWGERNTTEFHHPLSAAVPFLGRFLDMPARALPGDENMPRVQGPRHGASERLVVSPGEEELGIFEMPDGQSGNPLSPHYGDQLSAWEEGKATPFLPGRPVHLLHLVPGPTG